MLEATVTVLCIALITGLLYHYLPRSTPPMEPKVVHADLQDEVVLQEDTSGTGSAVHLHFTPPPGKAVVEVVRGDHSSLVFDTLDVSSAPRGTLDKWTNVIAPKGPHMRAYKYRLFAVGEDLPFDIPSHLNRSEASYYRVWWSMENANA